VAGNAIHQAVERRLSAVLGPNTARTALRTFCLRSLGKPPDALTRADVPGLVAVLRPPLRTLLGSDAAEQLLAEIAREHG
jgi:hypothetical protein